MVSSTEQFDAKLLFEMLQVNSQLLFHLMKLSCCLYMRALDEQRWAHIKGTHCRRWLLRWGGKRSAPVAALATPRRAASPWDLDSTPPRCSNARPSPSFREEPDPRCSCSHPGSRRRRKAPVAPSTQSPTQMQPQPAPCAMEGRGHPQEAILSRSSRWDRPTQLANWRCH